MSPVDAIADALVTHLEAVDSGLAYTVTKPEKPTLEVEGDGVTLQVIPQAGGSRQKSGRRCVRRTYRVNLLASATLSQDRPRADMLALVEEVLASLDFEPMAGVAWSQTEEQTLYDNEAILNADRFTSLHRLSYVEEVLV